MPPDPRPFGERTSSYDRKIRVGAEVFWFTSIEFDSVHRGIWPCSDIFLSKRLSFHNGNSCYDVVKERYRKANIKGWNVLFGDVGIGHVYVFVRHEDVII